MNASKTSQTILLGLALSFILACNALSPASTATVLPSLVPPTATSVPVLSQQLTLISQSHEESNQTPPFTIKVQTPQFTGSDDARVAAFNQHLSGLVTKEVDMWRKSFVENTFPTQTNGSFLEIKHTLLYQSGEVWSFKFDFHFYSDGAAHPGSYSITLNYDLSQGRELAPGDLFRPNADYLEAIASYCKSELSKQPFYDGAFTQGADPTPENYRRWNITPGGLLITFDEYQVAPYAAGPQQVTVPYTALRELIDPQGPLAGFVP